MTRNTDEFFNVTKCQRCGGELTARIMSWFTDETICLKCSDAERPIKDALRAKGYPDALEGCGYVPDPANNKPPTF